MKKTVKKITLLDNTKMNVFDGDHIGNVIERTKNYYELGMLNFISQHISKGVFVDVGSNIGNHTVFFSKYCASKVYSFEPNPEPFNLSLNNVIDNNLTNVEIFNLGLSNEVKDVLMFVPDGNIGMGIVTEAGDIPVKLIKFDSWYKPGKDPITCIKLDCEGFEDKVILGMKNTIEQYHPALFIECQTEKELFTMRKLLKQFHYSDKYVFNSTPTYEFTYNI